MIRGAHKANMHKDVVFCLFAEMLCLKFGTARRETKICNDAVRRASEVSVVKRDSFALSANLRRKFVSE